MKLARVLLVMIACLADSNLDKRLTRVGAILSDMNETLYDLNVSILGELII